MSTLWIVDSDRPGASGMPIDLGDRQAKVLGRSRRADVRLDDPRVSSRHAEVTWDGERALLRDLASRNGTWLSRGGTLRRLAPDEEIVLQAGDRVQLGRFLVFAASPLNGSVWLEDSDDRCSTLADAEAAAPVGEGGESSPVIEALERLAGVRSHREVNRSALGEAAGLVGADTGYLLTRSHDRWVLRASFGIDGPACLSRSFLEAARGRKEPWATRPAAVPRVQPEAETALDRYPDETVLIAVPFLGADGETSAIAYLTGSRVPEKASLDAAARFGRVAGAIVGGALELDRERRRREAAERREQRGRRGKAPQEEADPPIVGSDPAFLAAANAVRRAGGVRATILLRGPSGTGKEELARLAHRSGPRREHPFVALNCAALPEGLVEAELFGADRGSYTGAEHARRGSFENADGGTLFLDEIGDLPLAVQAKILRVIESGEVVRVGGSRCRIDARLVAATHRDLEAMVAAGSFREDLYYRLRVIEVRIPPLVDRPADILPLATHFLESFVRPDGQEVSAFSAAAIRALGAYCWPGNVRELRNVIERAVVVDRDGVIDLDDLPAELGGDSSASRASGDWGELLALPWRDARGRFERRYFQEALGRHRGRVKETAQATGLDRRTLSTKIREHRLKKRG